MRGHNFVGTDKIMTRDPEDSKTPIQKKLDQVTADQNELIDKLVNCNKDKFALAEVIHDLERKLKRCEEKNAK